MRRATPCPYRPAFTPLPVGHESAREARQWDVEEAAFVLFGAAPWRSFFEGGRWWVAFTASRHNQAWFREAFGTTDTVAIFLAVPATGPDTYEGTGFERVK